MSFRDQGSIPDKEWRNIRRKEREAAAFAIGYLSAVGDLGGVTDEADGKEYIEQAVWLLGHWLGDNPPIEGDGP